MKPFSRILLALSLTSFGFGLLCAQQGPKTESSTTVSRPKKKSGNGEAVPEPETDKIPSKYRNKGGVIPDGTPTFRSDVSTVTVDVSVLDKNGHFIPNIPRASFRVVEDGVPQQLSNFGMGEAPMTVAMVIEFSNLFQSYWSRGWYETLTYTNAFLSTLKPEDFVAVVAYDLRPEILSDFSTDKRKAQEAMQRLRIAAFRESNLYDALTDTADRMSEIEGRRAIVLFASGIDTFSKITFDQTRKKLQLAGVPIYSISILQMAREMADARGGMGAIQRLDFLQADNQLKTFAKETGGQAFFPRFVGEMGNIFQGIHESLRNQYSLGFQSTNQLKDGKFRKLKVELVNPGTNEPLKIVDEKNKPMKYSVIAKQGYTAPREVE